MRIVEELEAIGPIDHPTALTIGFFDGVHLGHQAIIHALKKVGTAACITFSNHPSGVLDKPKPLITTPEQKARLLHRAGVDLLIMLPFTKELSLLTPRQFLIEIQKNLPFDELILGYDAHIGHKRSGTPVVMKRLAKELGFKLTYLPPTKLGQEPISSSRVRTAIHQGNLKEIEALLGRPLSYLSTITRGRRVGEELGYPTANLEVEGSLTPPYGVYAVTLTKDKETYSGVANLGVAPTMRKERRPLLEVHLFNFHEELYDSEVEVTLHHFLRPEIKFNSTEKLRQQIAADVAAAEDYFVAQG